MNDRKPSTAFWATVFLIAALLFFPVSFGPAVWLASCGHVERKTVECVYEPILWMAAHGPRPVKATVSWWGSLGIPSGKGVFFLEPTSEGRYVMVCFGMPTLDSSEIGPIVGRHLGGAHSVSSNEN